MISLEDLRYICPTTRGMRLNNFVNPLNDAMREFEINTPDREAMFIAQIAHESGGFNYVKEIGDGHSYENRADLGNDTPGDGVRYKGRGLIQITGKANYRLCGDALGVDLVANPELLEGVDLASRSAAWFWHQRHLNDLADKGDFLLITKRINGGTNGYASRQAYLQRAQKVIV